MSTKPKFIRIAALTVIIWVSACSGSLPIQTPAPILSNASATIRVTPRPMEHTLQENKWGDHPLSPDGEWSVEKTWLSPSVTGELLIVDSTRDSTGKLSVDLPASLGDYFTFASWSPDSHSFAYYSGEKVHRCEMSTIIAFQKTGLQHHGHHQLGQPIVRYLQ